MIGDRGDLNVDLLEIQNTSLVWYPLHAFERHLLREHGQTDVVLYASFVRPLPRP